MSSGEVRITIKVRKRVLDRQKVAVGPRSADDGTGRSGMVAKCIRILKKLIYLEITVNFQYERNSPD